VVSNDWNMDVLSIRAIPFRGRCYPKIIPGPDCRANDAQLCRDEAQSSSKTATYASEA
jgi:hypothetical protein